MKGMRIWIMYAAVALVTALAAVVPVWAVDAAIYPGDTLRITVLGEQDLTRQVLVDPAGKITLPLAGEIEVAGKTTAQATADVIEALKKTIKNPQVTLEVAVPARRTVAISGAVKTPGLYPIGPTTKLADLLSLAGGTLQNADMTKVTVTKTETKQALTCNLQEFYAGRNPEGNVTLADGDSVMVPETGVVLVMGQARTPGPITLTSNMTVRQAIERAGGVTEQADTAKITLKRAGSGQLMPIDLAKAIQGDPTVDVALNPGDEIDIPAMTQIGMFTVVSGVRNPGSFPIVGQVFITDAIARAGGVSNNGRLTRVTIARSGQSIPVNIADIQAGKTPNVAVLPGDSITVAEKERRDPLRYLGIAASLFWAIF